MIVNRRFVSYMSFICLTMILTSNCLSQTDVKSYYYPIGEKKEVKVYHYIDRNHPESSEYWKVTTDPMTNTILTESFDTQFNSYNRFEERLVSDGAELIAYKDFQRDSNDLVVAIEAIVKDNDVYKWDDVGPFAYAVSYQHPSDSPQLMTKKRTRRNFEQIDINKISYATVTFLDTYEIRNLEDDTTFEFYQLTYYAEEIGMVKYKRYYPNGYVIILELSEILSESEFNQLRLKE